MMYSGTKGSSWVGISYTLYDVDYDYRHWKRKAACNSIMYRGLSTIIGDTLGRGHGHMYDIDIDDMYLVPEVFLCSSYPPLPQ